MLIFVLGSRSSLLGRDNERTYFTLPITRSIVCWERPWGRRRFCPRSRPFSPSPKCRTSIFCSTCVSSIVHNCPGHQSAHSIGADGDECLVIAAGLPRLRHLGNETMKSHTKVRKERMDGMVEESFVAK